ncbi:unnamed protein product [Prunus armeniaca]|uniref:Response regulatory domain-containing protein n=1 Tax=Prunus armeniaca TaxID=36596 RepID=A0A6J5WK26_PRUAR|nr:unnamed protein product [Prunus armeniaca]
MYGDKSLQGSQSDLIMNTSSYPKKLRVLVVDDDAEFLTFISGLLKLLKHEVVAMRNPIHALSSTLLLEEDKFDLIMADLYLPNVAGLQVIRRLREETKLPYLNIEEIVVSTDNRESTILAALEHGATHYIVKPVCFSDVRNLWQFVVGGNEGTRNPHIVVEQIGSVSGESSSYSNGDNNSRGKDHHREGKILHLSKSTRSNGLLNFRLEAVPKRILEVMNVEGLTRANIASHLQKYRMFLRKVAGRIAVSKLSVDLPQHTRRPLLNQNIPGKKPATPDKPISLRDNFELSVKPNAINLSLLGLRPNDQEATSSGSSPQSGYITGHPYLPYATSKFANLPLMSSTPMLHNQLPVALDFNQTMLKEICPPPIQALSSYLQIFHIASGETVQMEFILAQETPQPFTTTGNGNSNNDSWNNSNVMTSYTNNSYGTGMQMTITSTAGGGRLAGHMASTQTVFNNVGWDSNGVNNNCGDLVITNGTQNDDQNRNVLQVENVVFGYDFPQKESSSSLRFSGSSSSQFSPILAEGNNAGRGNVNVSELDQIVQQCSTLFSSSNNSSQVTVVDSSSSSTEISSSYQKDNDDAFNLSVLLLNELHLESIKNDQVKGKQAIDSDKDTDIDFDLFLNENHFGTVNDDDKECLNFFLGKGKQVMNFDPCASVVQESSPLNKESLAQHNGDLVDLKFDGDGDGLNMASPENLSLDEDWENIVESLFK